MRKIFYSIGYFLFLLFFADLVLQFYLKNDLVNKSLLTTHTIETILNDRKIDNAYSDISTIERISNREFDQFLPLGQISGTNIIHCGENGYISKYKSNSYGFNSKFKDTSITLIGDSYVEGACVNYKDTLAGNIENKTTYKINNLGISGSSSIYQFAILKEYLENNSKIILIFIENNDLVELKTEIRHPILYKYISLDDFSQNLKEKQKQINLMLKEFHEKKLNESINFEYSFKTKVKRYIISNELLYSLTLPVLRHLIKDIKNYSRKDAIKNINTTKTNLETFETAVMKINNLVKERNGKLTVVYLPAIQRLLGLTNQFDNIFENVEKILIKNNINYFDLTKTIISHPDPKSLYSIHYNKYKFNKNITLGHFNEDGYGFISEAIIKLLD